MTEDRTLVELRSIADAQREVTRRLIRLPPGRLDECWVEDMAVISASLTKIIERKLDAATALPNVLPFRMRRR